tara:strand:- start:421 stop:633 length:213 start_codon:yes stop_codon:yes gene_type:complete
MNFDTTHEYHIDDPFIHYNKENECIMICGHHGNNAERLVIYGLEAGVMNHFRLELDKEELEDVVNQDVPA